MRGDGKHRTCPSTGKVGYSLEINARRQAQMMAPRPSPFQAYPCPDCGEWHVGKVPAKKKGAKKR